MLRCTYGLVGEAGQTRAHLVFSVQWGGEEGESKPIFLVGLGLYPTVGNKYDTINKTEGDRKMVTVKVTKVEAMKGLEGLADGDKVSFVVEDDPRGRGQQAAEIQMG